MATALIPDPHDAEYERLKARAAGNNRSREAELPEVLVLASKNAYGERPSRVGSADLALAFDLAGNSTDPDTRRLCRREMVRSSCSRRPWEDGSLLLTAGSTTASTAGRSTISCYG
jgi:plasmid stability protein